MDNRICELCHRLPQLQDAAADIEAAVGLGCDAFRSGGTLYVCGNGGSHSDAHHIAGELMKGFLRRRPLEPDDCRRLAACSGVDGALLVRSLQRGLRTVVLGSHPALTTAICNDTDAAMAFAQPLYVLGRPGDLLLAISTSGNARNVVMACHVARARAMKVIALTGRAGGRLRELAEVCVRVPADDTYLVQELHLPVYHCLCAMWEEAFFED